MSTDVPVLAESLAVGAWRELSPGSVGPAAVETLKDGGFPDKGSVYRLCGVGAGGANVVAKRTHLSNATVESGVYERVLPALGVRAAAYYGSVPESDTDFCWLFFEEVRGEPVSTEHRALVTHWLAGLHTAASALPESAGLPSKGLAYYGEIVQVSRKQIADSLARDELDGRQREVLTRTLADLEGIESSWADLADLCAGLPETLMHGDFVAKNLILDTDGRIVAVDWGSAGWGPPATDLRDVDVPLYHAAVSSRWPDLSSLAIERASTAGHVFEQIARLRGITAGLPAQPSVRRLGHRGRKLADALRAAGFGSGVPWTPHERPVRDAKSPLLALAESLAIDALKRVQPDLPGPTEITTLKDSGFPLKTVHLLHGAGHDGADVVAKRCRRRKGDVEQAVYERLLPSIELRTPTFYGRVDEQGTRYCWLFVEYVHGERLSMRRAEHAALVDEWLARLHVGAFELPRPAGLPSKGPTDYFGTLERLRKRIADLLAEGELDGPAVDALRSALPSLELVEARWADVVELCAPLPETLTHGDLGEKNLLVDSGGELVPLDWGSAGWAAPATDLIRVDADRYHALIGDRWPDVSVEAIEGVASAGSLFRHLSAMRSAARDLTRPSLLEKFQDHHEGLAELLNERGWR